MFKKLQPSPWVGPGKPNLPLGLRGNAGGCIVIGRTDAEAEAPVLWPPDVTSQLIRKEPDAGKGLRQEEKGMTEVEMVGWHYQLSGHEFEQAPGDGEGEGSLTVHGVAKSQT